MLSVQKIQKYSKEFESKTPQEIIEWAADRFSPYIAMSSSFQTQSMPLLHMATRIIPDLPILFLDTGYHFWDTLLFREKIAHEWNLNIIDLRRAPRWDSFMRQNARTLPLEDPNLCCYLNKVEPMQIALKGYRAWISGIRRDQTAIRAKANFLELQDDGLLKINPLLNWKKEDVKRYIEEHNLPRHPLYEKGYRSVGCAPCTIAIGANEDERAGRWAGRGKVECGLHTSMFNVKDISESKSEFRLDVTKDA
ncbi:MAG: phosphoadenylyl-sulfate reductase [Chloroflexi bacterium]|nr:phosphoadenylyl-sulfate reductase [Chloroflexota bacterium]MCA2002957.1 phosphoadenylyl-sulfate reductase [Chloroflexota bacterium]